MAGGLTLGALVAFAQYSQRFFRPISDMSEKFNVLQAAMASSERIFKLLDEPVEIASPPTPVVPRAEGRGGHIVFDHVSFAYNHPAGREPEWVLKDVSFEVKPGERIGIVGGGRAFREQSEVRLQIAKRAGEVLQVIGEEAAVAQLDDCGRVDGQEQARDEACLRKGSHPDVEPLEVDEHPHDDLVSRRRLEQRVVESRGITDVLAQQLAAVDL